MVSPLYFNPFYTISQMYVEWHNNANHQIKCATTVHGARWNFNTAAWLLVLIAMVSADATLLILCFMPEMTVSFDKGQDCNAKWSAGTCYCYLLLSPSVPVL